MGLATRAANGGDWRRQGKLIGWVDGDLIHLDPDSSYAEMQRFAGEQGNPISRTPRALWKLLNEHGYLAATDENRKTLKIRKTIQGARREVVCLRAETLISADNLTTPTIASQLEEGEGTYGGQVVDIEHADGSMPDGTTGQGNGQTVAAHLTTENTTILQEKSQLVGLVSPEITGDGTAGYEEFSFDGSGGR